MTTTTTKGLKKAELEEIVIRYEAEKAEAEAKAKAGWTAKQKMAVGLGGVASLLVLLSVYHLTCGIATLTGSPIMLALLLAIGIDIGLVFSEVCETICHEASGWSKVYMGMATVMSMALNSYEFAAHAPEGLLSKGLSICFGLALPIMVYVLARQAIKCWQTK